jgi:hypothetical protein
MQKWYIHIPGQDPIPGLQVSDPRDVEITTSRGKRLWTQFVNIISFRGTNPANGPVNFYLKMTPEQLPFLTMRFDEVVGLDVDEKGQRLSLQTLEQRRGADIAAQQERNLAASTPATVDLDL